MIALGSAAAFRVAFQSVTNFSTATCSGENNFLQRPELIAAIPVKTILQALAPNCFVVVVDLT